MLEDLEGMTANKKEDKRVSVDAAFKEALEPSADRANLREVSKIDMKRGNELENVATMEALNEAGIDYDVTFDSELNVDSFVMDGNARGSLLSMDDDQVDALFQSESVVTSVNQAAANKKGAEGGDIAFHLKPMKERQFKLHAAEDLGREQAREHARQDQARAQRLAARIATGACAPSAAGRGRGSHEAADDRQAGRRGQEGMEGRRGARML